MKGIFPIDKFRTLQTPFYYYDTKVLRDTLSAINQEVAKYPNYSCLLYTSPSPRDRG